VNLKAERRVATTPKETAMYRTVRRRQAEAVREKEGRPHTVEHSPARGGARDAAVQHNSLTQILAAWAAAAVPAWVVAP
jgi:hypothetical protein